MSDFFSNMINRHLGTLEVAQPRPRARFEPENRVAEVNSPRDMLEEKQSPFRQEKEFRPVPGRLTETDVNLIREEDYFNASSHQGFAPFFEPGTVGPSNRTDLEAPDNETHKQPTSQTVKRQAPSAKKPRQPLERTQKEGHFNLSDPQEHRLPFFEPVTSGATIGTPYLETYRQRDAQRGNEGILHTEKQQLRGERGPEKVPSKTTSAVGYFVRSGLDNQIEQMLDRLRGDQNSGPSKERGIDGSARGSQSQPFELMTREQDGPIQPPSAIPSQASRGEVRESSKTPVGVSSHERRIAGTDKNPAQEISSTDRPRRDSGTLQPPSWLLDMQADFNQRWREMNSKSEAEQVINVTIGRIEVRAVPTEAPKQPKRNQKPSGVMSLDEYLNQRGRGGRT